MSNETEMLNVNEIAKALNVNVSTVYRLAGSSCFPSMKIGRKILISRAALMGWIKRNEHKKILL